MSVYTGTLAAGALTDCPELERLRIHTQHGQRWLLVGGAGFIGSHLLDRVLRDTNASGVTLYDNFSTGREWRFEQHLQDPRFRVIRGDAKDGPALRAAMAGHDVVAHLASPCDAERGVADPDFDFREGTELTLTVLEAMRVTGTRRILYASDSAVYGEAGQTEAHEGTEVREDHGPLIPVSTYGASKLAAEALTGAYCHRFGITGCAFRFGRVAGPRQTEGLGCDLIRQWMADPRRLRIPGGEWQSLIHVDDVVTAMLLAHERTGGAYKVFNIATGNSISAAEMARIAEETLGLDTLGMNVSGAGDERRPRLETGHGGTDDVRLDTRRLRALGWNCARPAAEALRDSLLALLADAQVTRF